jgi:hypothetical protein
MVTGWHFVGASLRDGRPIPPDGAWLTHDGPVTMCESGLHASLRPWQALAYAPGPVLCRVEVRDVVAEDADKIVGRARRILARRDLTELLWTFAREEAWRVAHLWACPDVVRRYLQTGDESLRAAAAAAAAAAWEAAGEAARAAAREAAWEAAAWAAAREAAWEAAWAAAREAAWEAAWEAAGEAARAAAREAAWEAAGARFDAAVARSFAADPQDGEQA